MKLSPVGIRQCKLENHESQQIALLFNQHKLELQGLAHLARKVNARELQSTVQAEMNRQPGDFPSEVDLRDAGGRLYM